MVNEAFCDIWEQREKRGSIVTPSLSLLYTIVRNKSVDYLRRRNSEQNYRDAYLLEVCTEVEAESCEEHEERLQRVMAAIEELSPQTRRVFEACFLENKSYKEVAAAMGISPNTVRNHIVSALKQIRRRNLVTLLLSVL